MWNPWKHMRLAGALMCIVGAIANTLMITLVGLMSVAIGVVGGLDRIERLVEMTIEKREDDDAVR